jgi:hypothetical protein
MGFSVWASGFSVLRASSIHAMSTKIGILGSQLKHVFKINPANNRTEFGHSTNK